MRDDFATFLVDRAAATQGEVLAALDLQQRSRLTIGRLALHLGVLDSSQVFTILAHQARHTATRFGEAAVALRMLGNADVDELLLEQRRRTAPLESFLVKAGVMDEERARALRDEFERLHPSTSQIRAAVPRAGGRTG